MAQVTDAIFSNGVLKPLGEIRLPEDQRVRLIIEPIDSPGDTDRAAALQRLREGIERMNFRLTGPLPPRAELHDRV